AQHAVYRPPDEAGVVIIIDEDTDSRPLHGEPSGRLLRCTAAQRYKVAQEIDQSPVSAERYLAQSR
ncbi:hypothetical protein, partial [Rhizobium sp. Pop5]|uniref:hypothetical protein n=1 Tax=Rhizobium sp. Pop5 TaxID=1223565 RepID=UPI000283B3BE